MQTIVQTNIQNRILSLHKYDTMSVYLVEVAVVGNTYLIWLDYMKMKDFLISILRLINIRAWLRSWLSFQCENIYDYDANDAKKQNFVRVKRDKYLCFTSNKPQFLKEKIENTCC